MAETFTGQVQNGVIVLDEGTPPLPEGMRLRLQPIDMEKSLEDLSQALRELAGTVEGLPDDYAENLDHYLAVASPPLPEGTRVRVEPAELEDAVADPSRILAESAGKVQGPPFDDDSTPTLADRLRPIIGAAKGLPPDLAEQHDHYIHGTPKR